MRRAQSPKPFAWVFSRPENSENWQGGRERRRWRAQREEERGKWKEGRGKRRGDIPVPRHAFRVGDRNVPPPLTPVPAKPDQAKRCLI